MPGKTAEILQEQSAKFETDGTTALSRLSRPLHPSHNPHRKIRQARFPQGKFFLKILEPDLLFHKQEVY